MASKRRTHVALIPSPGMGHVIPMAELAKLLLRNHNITSTFVVPTDGSASEAVKKVLSSLPSGISHVFLPPVNFDDFAEDKSLKIETLITLTVARSLPHLREALQTLAEYQSIRLTAIVADLFATDAFDPARELGLGCYVFFCSTASVLSLFLHLPELDAQVSGEYRDLKEPVQVPGLVPMPGSELLEPVQERKNEAYRWVMHNARRYSLADGIMVNSFLELEPRAVTALLERKNPAVYAVGPLVNKDSGERWNCLEWLDGQPHGSVLFVSFGSGGTLSSAQVAELAAGLERSEQRFLWVARRPNDAATNGTYFSGGGGGGGELDFLPHKFLDSTKGRGLVVPSWAPQAQILAHRATAGFLSHCGWNSTLESVVNGVPLIAWPLFAEQKMNAFMLEHETRIAMRLRTSPHTGLVEAAEISRLAKSLIEGQEGKDLRYRIKSLKDAASHALSPHGPSTKALALLALQWNHRFSNLDLV